MFGRLKRLRSCTQKRWQHNVTGGQSWIAEMPKMTRPQIFTGGQPNCAETPFKMRPRQFYRSRHDHAAMSRGKRSKGRVSQCSQECLTRTTLPNQLQGAIVGSQKCHHRPAPTEFGPPNARRNATNVAPNIQRPVNDRRNAIQRSPRNIKRKTNGQEIRKPNHRKDTVCMA